MRHTSGHIGAILFFLGAVASCAASQPPRRKISGPPPPPVRVAQTRVSQPAVHYLSFIPGQTAFAGIELSFELIDREGGRVTIARRRCGPLFDQRPLVVGKRRRLLLVFAEDKRLRLVGRSRMGATPRPNRVDLSRVARARLISLRRCALQTYRWRRGLPLPPGIDHVPNEGEAFERLTCASPLADPRLRQTFRYERDPDPSHASLELGLEFNRDYERGLALSYDLLDAKRQVIPGCVLRIKQPTVWEGQRKRYRIDVKGRALTQILARTAHLRLKHLQPRKGPIDHYIDVRIICRGRSGNQAGRDTTSQGTLSQPDLSPAYRRGAIIIR